MIKKFTNNSSFKIVHIADPEVAELSFDSYYSFEAHKYDIIRLEDDSEIYDILLHNDHIDAIVTQSITRADIEFKNLCNLPEYWHRKWVHFSDLDNHGIELGLWITNWELSGIVNPMFSITTPLYNTNIEYFKRAYNSLVNQTLNDWEWILVDDSPKVNYELVDYINKLKDIRVKYYRIKPTNGNIGLSKWRANCMASGRWLLEFDHDDMLCWWTLKTLKEAIEKFPNNKFIYSDNTTINENDDVTEPLYGENNFGLGFGHSYQSPTPNKDITIRTDSSGPTNNATIRHIVGIGNHFRCWERNFYFMIGGHNQTCRIADDYELVIRSFLNTTFTHIPVCCYMQRFDGNNSQYDKNTSIPNIDDIQRRVRLISIYYDKDIHNRLEELGSPDNKWIEGDPYETANLYEGDQSLPILEDIYMPNWV